jgi:mRNA interferase MazF
MSEPSRGEVWLVDLNPTKGREQAGSRPALIVSIDRFNHGASELVIVCPITSKAKGIPIHVRVEPPEAGLKMVSFIKCEDVRSISKARLIRSLGSVSSNTMAEVAGRLAVLLGI